MIFRRVVLLFTQKLIVACDLRRRHAFTHPGNKEGQAGEIATKAEVPILDGMKSYRKWRRSSANGMGTGLPTGTTSCTYS